MAVPKKYTKPKWAVSQLTRETGLIEDLCEHGVGHPNRVWLEEHSDESHWGVHGCDGCCSKVTLECIRERLYGDTKKDWSLRLSWCLSEPVCPIFSVVCDDDDEVLVKGRFADGSFASIEEELIKSCSEALDRRKS